MAPGERGRCLLKMIQICTCCKNCIISRLSSRSNRSKSPAVLLFGRKLWPNSLSWAIWGVYDINSKSFLCVRSSRSYRFVYRRTWRAMRMFNRRKVGDTLPGSSATREERQAHNLVVSPIYKSVWAWFDSIPHCCKTSTVTAWWCNLEMEPKSLMQHLYCQETATELYIKCIMCTARVGNDDVPNI